MQKFLRENGLSITFFALFLVCLAGHAFTGFHVYNEELQEHHQPQVTFGDYLTSGQFGETVAENWESEFFQMAIFVILSAFLVQKGSAESNPLEPEAAKPYKLTHAPWPVRKGGLILRIYEHSLSLSLFLLFLFSFLFHIYAGGKHYNEERAFNGEPSVTLLTYAESSQFWFESFQNWQSEFLSVGMLVILAIFLRQKGSSQSKPVDAPHDKTGE